MKQPRRRSSSSIRAKGAVSLSVSSCPELGEEECVLQFDDEDDEYTVCGKVEETPAGTGADSCSHKLVYKEYQGIHIGYIINFDTTRSTRSFHTP